MLKPEPKPTSVVCTVCGLPWDRHEIAFPAKGKKASVTLEDCVRVLKAELARRPAYPPMVTSGGIYAQPLKVLGVNQ